MLKMKCRGIFFIIFLCVNFKVYADDSLPEDLEKIIVLKNKSYLAGQYSLNSDDLGSLPYSSPVEALNVLPVDLQSRSPHAGIQSDFSMRGSGFQDVLILFLNQHKKKFFYVQQSQNDQK